MGVIRSAVAWARSGPRVVYGALPGLTAADVADVLAAIEPGVTRLLERRGVGDGDDGDRSDSFPRQRRCLPGWRRPRSKA